MNGYSYTSSSITSPHRASNSSQLGATSHPADYHNTPSSAGTTSPGFASPHNSLGLPNLNQQYQHDPNQYRGSGSHEFPPQESRRSSIGSQVNAGFSNMHLNSVSSPYTNSNNQSQSSIAVNLQRERGIPQNGVRNSGLSTTSSVGGHQQPMSPLGPYPGESRQAYSTRTAPSIGANPMKEVYNAEKPTAGQPYAFPDPDMDQSSGGSERANSSMVLSRRNSDHTSITSSIVTNDSKLPHGQHRLDERKFLILPDHITLCFLTSFSSLTRNARHTPSFPATKTKQQHGGRVRFARRCVALQSHACSPSKP